MIFPVKKRNRGGGWFESGAHRGGGEPETLGLEKVVDKGMFVL